MRKTLIAALLGSILIAISGCWEETPVTYTLTINDKHIHVEIADIESARVRGLQYRDSLAPDTGMLFVYNEDKIMSFWMKNTSIPLSIAFIGANGVIMEVFEMEPFSMKNVNSSAPARYALETNSGWFDRNQIKTGDKIIFPPDMPICLQNK